MATPSSSAFVEQVSPSTADATTAAEHNSSVNVHVNIALFLTINSIVAGIPRRLDFIGYYDISNDAYLTTAAKLLTIKDIYHAVATEYAENR